jgi:hypothetical protein
MCSEVYYTNQGVRDVEHPRVAAIGNSLTVVADN